MGYRDHLKAFPGVLFSTLRPPFGNGPKHADNVAWLDGLRGFAALLVYLQDFIGYSHENVWPISRAFGWDGNYYAICLPGVRMFVLHMLDAVKQDLD